MSLPTSAIMPVSIYTCLCAAYCIFAPFFSTTRKRAYILSVISSSIMSSVSLPYVYLYLRYGLHGAYKMSQNGWLEELGRFATAFFGTYLFADLTLGYLMYKSEIGLLTGWVHHTVYIGLMIYLNMVSESPVFLIAGIMEVPTLDLGLSNLFPQVRNDVRFLSSFFIIRIVFNLYFALDCARPSSRVIFDNAWMPTVMLSLALCLHVMWFKGGIVGYLKRQSKTSKSGSTSAVSEIMENPGLSIPATDSCPESPEDSPLITPHTIPLTPSASATSQKDNSFFPNLSSLPNLANIPHLGQLPTVSIPNLPTLAELTTALNNHREHMNFGFKDAVKSRIGEQRERFAGLTANRGINLNLGGALGNMGLRGRPGSKGISQREYEAGQGIEVVGVDDLLGH
ncbi:hypothetical protein BD324DRAFT_584583 [Kockovaella imperatae]|uniref:TLC domain-domain-containing protein n=1 Tax=Kockovaella imperatae TaxID=4999 RepID=A0A1Y1U9I7_9TREE|nr:hypothetical protein BD324DRAFT_584583 [Kockovaella imperatae]ORX33755.1 hypothetical protein BD324DRAFT_584583 [Kockovaella imperatae]